MSMAFIGHGTEVDVFGPAALYAGSGVLTTRIHLFGGI